MVPESSKQLSQVEHSESSILIPADFLLGPAKIKDHA